MNNILYKLTASLCAGYCVLLLNACGGGAQDVLDALQDPSADPDEDGLTNNEERTVYFTAPDIADTDGDGLSDGDEVLELGFNPSANPYRFNPLIADLPTIGINIETVPEIILRYTDSSGTEHETSTSSTTGTVKTSGDVETSTGTLKIEEEVVGKVGTDTGAEVHVTVSGSRSFSTATYDTTDTYDTLETVNGDANFQSRTTDSASIRVGVSIENTGNLAYSLEHISLLSSYFLSDATLKPVATLSYDSSGGGFSRTSFAPGEQSNLLLFSYDNLELDTALVLLRDVSSLIVEPALYELTDEKGKPVAFHEGDVQAKTAFVTIDYAVQKPLESYHVAVLGSLGQGSVTLDVLLSSIIQADYTDSGGITGVRGIQQDATSRWVVVVTHNDGFVDKTSVYDIANNSYAVSSIELFPGDRIALVYMSDKDGDTVGLREELIHGTDPAKRDTDGDGLDDNIEIRNAYQVYAVNVTEPDRYPVFIKSNPLLADADGDKLKDGEERTRGLDPFNPDTDGDGISDKIDTVNGALPIAGLFTLTMESTDTFRITGSAVSGDGADITNIDIDWDFVANPGVTVDNSTGASPSLTINHSNTYTLAADTNPFTIRITVTSNDGLGKPDSIKTAIFEGSVELFQETHYDTMDVADGWSERNHIREVVDIDDDGDLDLVGFGDDGVIVSKWNGSNFDLPATTWLVGHYGSAVGGGSYSKTEHPRFLVDYDGDDLPDIIAFAAGGVVWSKNDGSAFVDPATGTGTIPETIVAAFGSSSGWNSSQHIRQIADVDGNNIPDIVAFGADDVLVFLGGGTNPNIINASDTFAYNDGWRKGRHYRMLADVDGDGHDDIVASGTSAMFVALGQPDGTFGAVQTIKSGIQSLSESNGWDPDFHPIILEDVDNDNKLDIIGFGAGGAVVMMNESIPGTPLFADGVLWHNKFHINNGWQVAGNRNPRFIADTNGDGFNDLAGFGNLGVIAALNRIPEGNGDFSNNINTIAGASFNVDTNWHDTGLYNSRYIMDVNNDGRADAIGFSNDDVFLQRSPIVVQPVMQ